MEVNGSQVEFGATKRGKQTVLYKGQEFWKKHENGKGEMLWRCNKFQTLHCKAHLKTLGDRVISATNDHTHEGNRASSLARKAVNEMKIKMNESLSTPGAAQSVVMRDLSDNVLMALPKRSVVGRSLRRYRMVKNKKDDSDDVLPALPSDVNFIIPARFQPFILYDSITDPDQERVIIFGDRTMLEGLERASIWLADGTFKKVPHLFFQLYTIHFQLVRGVNPAGVYCLLPSKSRNVYERLMTAVKHLIPNAAPGTILVDFERAAMDAFATAFPEAHISGCYFHLCQSLIRKVQEVGMKSAYESDSAICSMIRCLPALAFVPLADIEVCFEALCDAMPPHEHMDEILSYFEHTYVRGRRARGRGQHFNPPLFSPELWNKREAATDGIARTTNAVEGWHNSLQSLFMCDHPTMWIFFDGLRRDMALQKAQFLQSIAGVQQAPKKKYVLLDQRVLRAIATYGQSDVITYLRAMAHLSFE